MRPERINPLPAAAGPPPARVMLVDDSAVVRAVFEMILAGMAGVTVVHSAANVEGALDFLAHGRADIILLDIEMPGRSGLDALPDLLRAARGGQVLIVSAHADADAPAAVQALALGACDTLAKPRAGSLRRGFAVELSTKISAISASRQLAPAPPAPSADRAAPDASPAGAPLLQAPACVAIGASTGGISALMQLLGALDPVLPYPVLITQHLPPTFVTVLAGQLQRVTGRDVVVASEGMPMQPGQIYLAPGIAHLSCRAAPRGPQLTLTDEARWHGYRSSVDPMLAGVAQVFGPAALGVMLTGMGRDGLDGARALVEAGGTMIVQDAASSVVWGMPGAVARAGLARASGSPAALAALINDSLGRAAPSLPHSVRPHSVRFGAVRFGAVR